MARRILVVPVTDGAGVTAACLGLAQALNSRRVAVAYAKPFEQAQEHGYDQSTELFRLTMALRPPQPIPAAELEKGLAGGRLLQTMSDAIELTSELDASNRVLVLEGLAPTVRQPAADRIDLELAQAYDAEVLLVGSAHALTPDQLAERMETMTHTYTVRGENRVMGAVVNRVANPEDCDQYVRTLEDRGVRVVAAVASQAELTMRRVSDVVRELGLRVVREGELDRRVVSTSIIAENAPTFLSSFVHGRMILVPGNRHEVLMGAALAEAGGIRLAAVLLTGGMEPDPAVLSLCEAAAPSKLPILSTSHRTFESAQRVLALDSQVPGDDEDRARLLMETFADAYDPDWLDSLSGKGDRPVRMTPARFERLTMDRAFAGVTRVAVSDGTDPRVLRAICSLGDLSYLRCVVVSPSEEVERVLEEAGLQLPSNVVVVDPREPDSAVSTQLERARARTEVEFADVDPFARALALQAAGEVDGVVGGIAMGRPEAHALIAAFVELRSDAVAMSASQFVQMPDEVLAFADTVLIGEPDERQLACIAVQTAATAELYGLEPRISFIRPSSSSPHVHEQTERIRQAMELLREKRPDLPTRGPVPFGRATARLTTSTGDAENSTVLVFPEIASATATVRAVTGGVGVWACPPLLQGLTRAVNTLPSDGQVRDVAQVIVGTAKQATALS